MTDMNFNELWGTFSVFDHAKPDAFIAEVLLYDKLVIPVKPKNPTKQERDRWKKWDQNRQKAILNILKDRAVPVPWGDFQHNMWKDEWKKKPLEVAKCVRSDLAGELTARLLLGKVPAHAKSVIAVSPYNSWQKLKADMDLKYSNLDEKRLPGQVLTAVLGRELMVPEGPIQDYFPRLKEAVKMANNPEYREKRTALNEWQQRFLTREELTDVESVKEALNQMNKLVSDLKKVTKGRNLWKGVRRALFVAQLSLSIPFAPIPMLAAANAALAIGTFVASETLEAYNKKQEKPKSAAAVLEARSGFQLGNVRVG